MFINWKQMFAWLRMGLKQSVSLGESFKNFHGSYLTHSVPQNESLVPYGFTDTTLIVQTFLLLSWKTGNSFKLNWIAAGWRESTLSLFVHCGGDVLISQNMMVSQSSNSFFKHLT